MGFQTFIERIRYITEWQRIVKKQHLAIETMKSLELELKKIHTPNV